MCILKNHQHGLWSVTMPPPVTRVLPMSSAGAARRSCRVRDNVRRSAATTCRQRATRPAQRSRFARAAHRACRASLVRYRREQIRRPFHLADDRIKRAVGVLRRTEVAQASVRFGCEAFQQRRREPRLADTCLAGEQHHLAFAGLRLRPAPQQQFKFLLATDKLGQSACVQSLEAAFD